MKGVFINFEGIDSSGKKTQTDLLEKALKEKGHKIETLSFPAYSTTFGRIVASYLRGEYYSLKDAIPEIPCLLFATDRYQFKNFLEGKLKEGKIIICNRFTQSAMAFEGTMQKESEREKFIEWIELVESRLPQPDLVFLIDMPVEASTQLIKKRDEKEYLQGKKKDILEEDLSFQEAVRNTYLEMAEKDKKRWVIVECAKKVNDEWMVRTPDQITRKY